MGLLKSLEIDYSYDIAEEFLSHYALMCDLMEPLIISLSRPDRYAGSINELFRIFHNIKSYSCKVRFYSVIGLIKS